MQQPQTQPNAPANRGDEANIDYNSVDALNNKVGSGGYYPHLSYHVGYLSDARSPQPAGTGAPTRRAGVGFLWPGDHATFPWPQKR